MKNQPIILGVCLFLALVVSAVPVAADQESLRSSYVYVSSVTMDPEVLYPYEQGTLTITVSNSGNESIGLSNPDLLSEHVLQRALIEKVRFISTRRRL